MGGKRFQARASSALKPPQMVRAELASSALRSRPWRDIHAIGLSFSDDETGRRLSSRKLVERRRREPESADTETTHGGDGAPLALAIASSSMGTETQRLDV